MLAGFKSRWSDSMLVSQVPPHPQSAARSAALLRTGTGPRPIRSASVSPSTSSSTRAWVPSSSVHAVDARDVRVIQRGEDFGFLLETREPS